MPPGRSRHSNGHGLQTRSSGWITRRIREGYRVDLTAFGIDPLSAPPDELAEAPIRLTLVDGRVVHRA